MTTITVECGNGGDWEWVRDQALWQIYIDNNITNYPYRVFSDKETAAHQAKVNFDREEDAFLFALLKPKYITREIALTTSRTLAPIKNG